MAEQFKKSAWSNDRGASCIDTYQICDSCRNQECLEDLRILVTDAGQSILDRSSSVRIRSVKVQQVKIASSPVGFERGYYRLDLRFFLKSVLECCTGNGIGEEVHGLSAFDKSVILFGGESHITSFQSSLIENSFCQNTACAEESLVLPRAVVEVAKPVPLRLNIINFDSNACFGCDICPINEIPQAIASSFCGCFTPTPACAKTAYLTVGIFSLVRFERPNQLVIPACDVCLPSKEGECDIVPQDPCSLFRSMEFPVHEFCRDIPPCDR